MLATLTKVFSKIVDDGRMAIVRGFLHDYALNLLPQIDCVGIDEPDERISNLLVPRTVKKVVGMVFI